MQSASGSISHDRLANGLEVVVIPDHRTPVVTHMVWYRNGAADDPVGKSGIAHFLEHLMFKGTKNHVAGEFSEVVSDLGGQENAFTSMDYTAYFQRVAKEHLETMMHFEADRMHNLILSDEVVVPERDVVIEERRMRTDNDPSAQLSESLAASLFVHHPYGTPIIGWMHEIEQLGREDALHYYGRFYTPANAILVVAGDVMRETVLALAERTYGALPADGETPVRTRPHEPEPRTERSVRLNDAKVEQPSLQRMYLVPSFRTAEGRESEALELLAHLLGSAQTGWFYRKLVVEETTAVNAGAWYMGTAYDRSRFGTYAVPAADVTLENLDQALERCLSEFIQTGPSDAELTRAKTRMIADAIYAQDSQVNLARMYGSTLASGGTIADVQEWPSRVEAVTRQDILAAAKQYLVRGKSVAGFLDRAA